MKRPEVTLENAKEVYKAYGDKIKPSRIISMGASAIIASILKPNVDYIEGAREPLKRIIHQKEQPTFLMINHQDKKDPFVLTAAAWRSVLRPAVGRVRTAAKDELFPQGDLLSRDGFQRRYVDVTGCFPVFRGDERNHGPGAVKAAWLPMREFCADQLVAGNGLAFFGEGTCNVTDPARIQKVQLGAAHIALRAAAQDVFPVFVPVGIYYGDREIPEGQEVLSELTLSDATGASVVFGRPLNTESLIEELKEKNVPKGGYARAITGRVHDGMQDALDFAIELKSQ